MLLLGVLLWLPQIWSHDAYPVEFHRYLVLNGFTVLFIAGHLLTRVGAPKYFVMLFMTVTVCSIPLARYQVQILSIQGILLAYSCFKFQRPTYFIWTLCGLSLWFFGIQWAPLFPITVIALHLKNETTVDKCLWGAMFSIFCAIVLNIIWPEGGVHARHAFFIGGSVLFFLLSSLRLARPHENSKWIFTMSGLVIFAMSTRVSAYLLPKVYLTHLGYSSLILVLSILIWIRRYFHNDFNEL